MTPALILALALMTAAPPDDGGGGGEPLPPGAPSDSYELSAWCYGALNEYLTIYDEVKPDLRDIDRMFGTSVVEDEPYQSDMAAARVELKLIGDAVTDAEKASPRPIAPRGAAAMRQGASIWSLAEAKPHRELARAWMLWALPDACDSNARALMTRSLILGRALTYNTGADAQLPAPSAPRVENAPAPTTSSLDAAAQTPPPADAAPQAPPPSAEAAPQAPSADADAAPTAEAAPATAAVDLPPAAPPPAANLAAEPPPSDAAEAAAPPAAPEVVSVQPETPPPVAAPPTAVAPAPPTPTAEQTPAHPPAAPGSDQPQEPTL